MAMEGSNDDVNLHDVEDYSSDVSHDQLPSVEEIRSQAHVTIQRSSKKHGKPWYIALGVIVLTVLLVAIAVPASNKPPRGDKQIGKNVEKAVHRVSMNGKKDFKDDSSFQSISKRWLMEDEIVQNYTYDQLQQRYAMYVLYHATNVDGTWVDATGWKRKGMSECTWYGVTCDDDGLVTRIELRNNGLGGEIPPEVSLIPNLHVFNVKANPELEGEISHHICALEDELEVKVDCDTVSCGCCITNCATERMAENDD
mmetsp:Transcript_106101/g.306947  ORF Transcript_106101/g.306947 Transcript_106101/m.306947 type:complete len:255 (-) Transcript_106101:98-862(-)|eukprot:CAMPEP_0176010432 /NCGR_PEP_ID=MMETSP0120_2-20121206/4764_1 /TAXON_ID=160619 /ORGANISM="Kryptoperidinium foliaceum, Strain CCMP 1326" /LENGTH=254 /DNA_ID=CAMNT_0017343261 /DNA_START=89 /DNA_END=853 /DNA_ORIENTATION=+